MEDYSIISSSFSFSYQGYCHQCERRLATDTCLYCNHSYCNSCYECIHLRLCTLNPKNISSRHHHHHHHNQRPPTSSSAASAASTTTPTPPICVQCGEPADQQCEQCHDYYCSRVWMGNPGCFQVYHSKGNRIHHTLKPIMQSPSPPVPSTPQKGTSNRLTLSKKSTSRI